MRALKIYPNLIIIISYFFLGWGDIGHKIINYNTILSALPEMEFFETWADSLEAHASDADYRKSWDPNEYPKHFIDLDDYPEFLINGNIPQHFDSLVAIYGYQFVIEQGILPWAILETADSLKTLFEIDDMHQAMLVAADLGHYVADANIPLHVTRNSNGQYSNQYGIHLRYESFLIQYFHPEIIYNGDTLQYIDNVPDFVFNMIYDNYQYVDSVLNADIIATAFAGNDSSATYYNKLWDLTKNFTIGLFQKASYKLTCIIYTEWIDSGRAVDDTSGDAPTSYCLLQNYPNPFNPSTKIKFEIPERITNDNAFVTLKVYDVLGNEVATLVSEEKPAGAFEVEFNGTGIPSGVYFYQLRAGKYSETRKMALLK